MALRYTYSGTATANSGTIKKRTNYSQPLTLFISSTVNVTAEAVKILVKDHQDNFTQFTGLTFGGGFHQVELPTGIEFQVDVDNGGVDDITVDVYV